MLRQCEQQQKRQHREQRAGTAGDVGRAAGQETHCGQDPGLGSSGSRDAEGDSRALCWFQPRCTPFLSALVSSSRQEIQAWRCWGNSLDLELGGGGRSGAVQRGWAMALGRRMARGVALCQIRECCSPAPGEDCCSCQTPFGDFSPSCVRAG